jgi:hypothetical protein
MMRCLVVLNIRSGAGPRASRLSSYLDSLDPDTVLLREWRDNARARVFASWAEGRGMGHSALTDGNTANGIFLASSDPFVAEAASGDDDALGARVNEKFIERKWPASVGLDRDVTDLDAVDRPFVHIARIVHDLGEWHPRAELAELGSLVTLRWRKMDSNLWFRISGKRFFYTASEQQTGREPQPVLTTDNGRFTVGRARLAPAMISTPGHRAPEGANARPCQPGPMLSVSSFKLHGQIRPQPYLGSV